MEDVLRRPPAPAGMRTGAALALLVHAGLIVALAYGVAWRRTEVSTVTAELWSAVPQAAAPAPRAVEPPPPPPAPEPRPVTPAPSPPPAVAPKPAPKPAPPPPPAPDTARADADIALAKARKKAEEQRRRDEEDTAKARLKAREDEAARKLADRKAEQKRAEADKAAKAALADKKRLADKQEAERKKAEEQKQAERDAKARAAATAKQEKADAALTARQREANLERLRGQLGAAGPAEATGTSPAPAAAGRAAQSAAPSAGYEDRIRAYIRPNIVYTGRSGGSVVAEVEVRVAPNGEVTGSRLLKSSGVADWDQAVLRAVERTARLPTDTDGRVPPVMVLSFDLNRR